MTAALKSEVDALVAKIADKKEGQAALEGLAAFAEEKGGGAQAFLVAAFDKIMEATGDKSKDVKDAALAASKAILAKLSPFCLEALMPALLAGLAVKAKPPQKEATLQIIAQFAGNAPKAIGFKLVELVAPVAELTCDIKKEVKAAAIDCMTAICACTGNKDLDPFLDAVVEAAQSIDKTHKCVERLAGCVFVQNVETPALAIMMPVLTRGLHDKAEKVKRTCCLIVDNMCKVVEDPAAVLPVMGLLEPLVRNATEQISDPEARSVAERAYKTLTKAAEGAESKVVTPAEAKSTIKGVMGDKLGGDEAADANLSYVAALASMATNMRSFDAEDWKSNVAFTEPFPDAIEEIRVKMEVASKPAEEIEDEDDEGVDLYKGSFSLAYGTLTLLRDTKMHLKRNRFYGLLGPNQCGKTTLMRAIAR
eukprot:CAMPEP_0179135494 /NCGR_PEP_ID=MMETSP0796-20121207/64515_1 /TAXON_ID=73915 /ORGANISM="Pyrodinium bahamense, Strain pbaha01" /LENGTH=421 /DNA_ID=CAMNT_0020834519 /DNA_START=55 /DNA_END=1316 /DNA_ORIENTATION=-